MYAYACFSALVAAFMVSGVRWSGASTKLWLFWQGEKNIILKGSMPTESLPGRAIFVQSSHPFAPLDDIEDALMFT